MRIAHRVATAAAALAFISACSGDSITETSGDPLSEQEVQEIFAALSAIGNSVLPLAQVVAPSDGPQLAPVPIDEDFSDSAPCPNGGTLTVDGNVSGTIDDETFDADLEFDLKQDMNACGITTASDVQFVLDGAPDIDVVGSIVLAGESISGSLSYQGGFSWEADDGRSGTCGVDVDVSVSSTSQTGTASGTICDLSISFTQ
jgi:hypothetical protein